MARIGDGAVQLERLCATPDAADTNPSGPIPLRPAQRPEELRAIVEDNLRSLGCERLDMLYLRRRDAGPGLRASGEQDVPPDDRLATMTALREEGKIATIGISGTTPDVVRRALVAGTTSVAHLEENLGAGALTLPAAAVRTLDSTGRVTGSGR